MTRPRKDRQVHEIWMEADEEELFIETREEFSTLITITVLTVMGDHVYGSSLHDGID